MPFAAKLRFGCGRVGDVDVHFKWDDDKGVYMPRRGYNCVADFRSDGRHCMYGTGEWWVVISYDVSGFPETYLTGSVRIGDPEDRYSPVILIVVPA